MTKDEAIKLKSILEEISVTDLAFQQRDLANEALGILATIEAPTSEAVAVPVWELFADGWDGVDDLDGDWMQTLPIGTKLYYLPAEAVAEKPQDDRNAASPAAPASQRDAAGGGKWVPLEPTEAMIRAACINQAVGNYADYDAWWNSHSGGVSEKIRDYVTSDYRVMIAAAPEVSASPVPRAQGGITKPDWSKQESHFVTAPNEIAAQGIDHAKLESAIRDAELWRANKLNGGDPYEVCDVLLGEVERLTALARGQQAGVPEVQKTEVV